MKSAILQCRTLLKKWQDRLEWLPPLTARLILGAEFIQTGWGKLHNHPKVLAYFTELHIPAPDAQAWFVSGLEFFGGILLLLGLATRLISVPLMVVMVVATMTAKLPELEDPGDIVTFIEVLYFQLLLWLALRGAGLVSVDAFVARRIFPRNQE